MTADRSPSPRPRRRRTPDTAQPDAAAHLYPAAATPELSTEHRLRFFFTSVEADHVTPPITEEEALTIASGLEHVAWVVERRMVGPWVPTTNVQRNRTVRDLVDPDDPADLHPNVDRRPEPEPDDDQADEQLVGDPASGDTAGALTDNGG